MEPSRCPVHIFSTRSERQPPLSRDDLQDGVTLPSNVQGKSLFTSTVEFDPFFTGSKKHQLSFNGWGVVDLLREDKTAGYNGSKLCDCESGCSGKNNWEKSSLSVALKDNGTGRAIEYEGKSCTRFTSEEGNGNRTRNFTHCPIRDGACTCKGSTTYEPSGRIHVFTKK